MVKVDSVSKKWCEEILFALEDGSQRFNQLLNLGSNSNMRISSRTLSNRLKELEEQKLIVREIVNERPPTSIYKLTNKGKRATELVKKLKKL